MVTDLDLFIECVGGLVSSILSFRNIKSRYFRGSSTTPVARQTFSWEF